jgi:hypothetical protein
MTIVVILLGGIGVIAYNIYLEGIKIQVRVENKSEQTLKKVKIEYVSNGENWSFDDVNKNSSCTASFPTKTKDSLRLVCTDKNGKIYEEIIVEDYEKGYEGSINITIKENDGTIVLIADNFIEK